MSTYTEGAPGARPPQPPADDTTSSSSTVGTAREQGKEVASTAKSEAHHIAGEVRHQASGLLDSARQELADQSRTQKDRLSGTLRSVSDELDGMTSGEGGDGMVGQALRQIAERTRRLTDTLENREPAELLDDVRAFARRRPGTFLLGSLAAGVVAGRLVRGAGDGAKAATAGSDSGSFTGTSTMTSARPTSLGTDADAVVAHVPGTATGDPLAGTGTPAGTAVDPESTQAMPHPGLDPDERITGVERP